MTLMNKVNMRNNNPHFSTSYHESAEQGQHEKRQPPFQHILLQDTGTIKVFYQTWQIIKWHIFCFQILTVRGSFSSITSMYFQCQYGTCHKINIFFYLGFSDIISSIFMINIFVGQYIHVNICNNVSLTLSNVCCISIILINRTTMWVTW